MREIENYNGVIESHPEYGLILDANDLSTEVDDEISALFQYIRDLYSKRFPELESLISNPLDYVRSVRIIGNELNMRLVDEDLRKILPGATVMVITVTASTTKGLPLSESETRAVKEACENTIELSGFKERIMNYVQSRMTIIAPNLSALVGSKTAAQLMRSAGGLGVLSKTPSCNVGMIGMSKKHLAGLSSASADLHVGHIHHAEGMHDLLPAIRKRALRVLSAK